MNWRETPLFGFDTETTGIDVETCRIVTACVGWANPATGTWSPVNWLLKKTKPIPAEATAIHGITTEQANAEGMDPAAAIAGIRDALDTYWRKGWPLCGYNLAYDLTLLDRESRRHGLGGFAPKGPIIDGYVADKTIDKYRKGSRKLAAVAAHHGITLTDDDAHGAEPDALAATRLAWVLAPKLPDNAALLNAWQATNYRLQRQDFASYLRKQGKRREADEVLERLEWPIEPTPTQKAA